MSTGSDRFNSPLLIMIPLILLAMIFQILKMPEIVSENKPNLLALILIFFAMKDALFMKMEIAWILGLLMDLISGAPLGINAFITSAQVYIISLQFKSFPKYEIWQQAIIVGSVNLLTNAVGYWLEHIIGQGHYEVNLLIPAALMTLLWPIICVLCIFLSDILSINLDKEQHGRSS